MKKFITPNFKSVATLTVSALALSSLLFVTSCKPDETESTDPLDEAIAMMSLEKITPVEHPANNPSSEAKVELGRMLFWDPILGGEKDMACVGCHHPDLGYGDGLDLPIGVNGSGLGPDRTENTGGLSLATPIERVPRNAPSILNTAYNGMTSANGYDPMKSPMFWDSRSDALEGQCQGPPTSRSEMRGDAYAADDAIDSIVTRVANIPAYVSLFDAAFGTGNSVTPENFTFAMGAFERTLVAVNSSYDKYLAGNTSALTSDQKNGLILFNGKAKCSKCHTGPMFSDFDMHVIGIKDNPKNPGGKDLGLDDEYKFRTPTLRNISLTGPYTHSGMYDNLRDMVVFMSSGTSGNPDVTASMVDTDFEDRHLTDKEVDQIVSFLESLTDEDFDKTIPTSVPSGLKVGGSIN